MNAMPKWDCPLLICGSRISIYLDGTFSLPVAWRSAIYRASVTKQARDPVGADAVRSPQLYSANPTRRIHYLPAFRRCACVRPSGMPSTARRE